MKKSINKKRKGFTLIEVIVAVTIVIILATLAVPKVSGYLSKAKETKAMSMGKQIYTAAMWSYAENGNQFVKDKVSDVVTQTTSINLTSDKVEPNATGKSVIITFSNDNKDYKLSINEDTTIYTINDVSTTPPKPIFTSTQ